MQFQTCAAFQWKIDEAILGSVMVRKANALTKSLPLPPPSWLSPQKNTSHQVESCILKKCRQLDFPVNSREIPSLTVVYQYIRQALLLVLGHGLLFCTRFCAAKHKARATPYSDAPVLGDEPSGVFERYHTWGCSPEEVDLKWWNEAITQVIILSAERAPLMLEEWVEYEIACTVYIRLTAQAHLVTHLPFFQSCF